MFRLLLAHYNQTDSDALIARAIAFGIEEEMGGSAAVTIERMNATSDVGEHDAFVIGTDLAEGHWPNITRRFLHRNARSFAEKPIAIYLALTARQDSATRSLVQSALASNRTKQFVAQRMPLQIAPHDLRGIALFTPSDSPSRFTRWLESIYETLFRPSPTDAAYATAGRVFGKRLGVRFAEDCA